MKKLTVIGVCTGGFHIIECLSKNCDLPVNCIVANPDKYEMKDSTVEFIPWHREEYFFRVDNYIKSIKPQIEDYLTGTTHLIVVAALGSENSGQISEFLIKEAKAMGINTALVASIPFTFEGRQKISSGLAFLSRMKSLVDACGTIYLSKDIYEAYPNVNFFDAFQKADDYISKKVLSVCHELLDKDEVNNFISMEFFRREND